MEGQSPTQASTPTGAVFLSYASQDAEAAERICDALRAAGVEVWLDKSDLRGGDAWDRSIRQQIHDCALFVPIISQHTHERLEGYFRREWKLAVDRTHDMAEIKAFLVPVVIDSTTEQDPAIPEKFRELQWTRLPAGETPAAFVDRVQRLLSGETSATNRAGAAAGAVPAIGMRAPASAWSSHVLPVAAAVVVLGAVAYLAIERPWVSKPAASATFAPPAHSLAVLPFVNMSGDKDQEYFSEGLTEELLDSLSRIKELQVAARTSSFSFQGEHPDIATVAHKLNVGAVLEGSVRRSANTVRITAQLVNGVTGFHLWSETYDRDLGDVLKLQTEIATAVASALKVNLLGGEAAKIEVGGTRNPGAFDAYLRGSRIYWTATGTATQFVKVMEAAIADYNEAINLDPDYALAYAARSLAFGALAQNVATPKEIMRVSNDQAQSDARRAITLAPDLAEGHLAFAVFYLSILEFTRAPEEYERAVALAPGNARVARDYGSYAVAMGRKDVGLNWLRRAVVLDPLNINSHTSLGGALLYLRRYDEGIAAFKDAKALDPDEHLFKGVIGLGYYLLGDLQAARANCEASGEMDEDALFCLALTYDKLGRHADAEGMLAKLRTRIGDSGATYYSDIYAQWGDKTKALEWLETAMKLRESELQWLRLDPLADPLRNEPRFQAVQRELKFPS